MLYHKLHLHLHTLHRYCIYSMINLNNKCFYIEIPSRHFQYRFPQSPISRTAADLKPNFHKLQFCEGQRHNNTRLRRSHSPPLVTRSECIPRIELTNYHSVNNASQVRINSTQVPGTWIHLNVQLPVQGRFVVKHQFYKHF